MQVPGPAPAAADRRQLPRSGRCPGTPRTRCPAGRSFQVRHSRLVVRSRRRIGAKSCRAIRYCLDRCRAAHASRIRDYRVPSTRGQRCCPRVRDPVLALLMSPGPSSRKTRTRWLPAQFADDAAWVLRCDIEQGVRRSRCGYQPRVARSAILMSLVLFRSAANCSDAREHALGENRRHSSRLALHGTSVWLVSEVRAC